MNDKMKEVEKELGKQGIVIGETVSRLQYVSVIPGQNKTLFRFTWFRTVADNPTLVAIHKHERTLFNKDAQQLIDSLRAHATQVYERDILTNYFMPYESVAVDFYEVSARVRDQA